MNEVLSGVNGEVTEQLLSYFAARAKGGTALVSTGAIMGTELCQNSFGVVTLRVFTRDISKGLH